MKLDNALNLQAEVFRKVFAYDEVPAAFGAGGNRFGTPTFVEPEGGLFPAVSEEDSFADNADAAMHSLTGSRRRRRSATTRVHSQARDIALGVGFKNGDARGHQLVVLYQDRQLKDDRLLGRINDMASGEARFSYVGRARALTGGPWHRKRVVDPLRIGSSLGHFRVSAGTLGCFVSDRSSGERGVLSNNHVLANLNRARAGDEIRQPA
ncbi:MAG: hypothetical protein ACPGJE_03570, partial [Wenzhouxiangellaceae bacterium]